MADRLVSVDDNFDFPQAVAARQAERLADPGTIEGAALVSQVQTAVGPVRAGVAGSPPISVSQFASVGAISTRITAVEAGRTFLILRASDIDVQVASGWPDSTTDPGTGYETVPAGTEILIANDAPVWAKAAASTNVTLYKEVRP